MTSRKYVSLDPLDIQAQAKEDPRLFLANNPPPIIFDKIQNVPKLLHIKRFAKLDELKMPIGMGALVSLYPDTILIKENVKAIPAYLL